MVIVVVVMVVAVAIVVAVNVADSNFVTAPESVAVVAPQRAVDVRMAILVPVVHIRAAVVSEVLAGAFDAIMEAAARCVLKLLWGSFPAAFGAVLICTWGRRRRSLLILCVRCSRAEEEASGECSGGEDSSQIQGIPSFGR